MATFCRISRTLRRAWPSFCSVLVLFLLATPVLHSQDVTSGTTASEGALEAADAEVHSNEVADVVSPAVLPSADDSAQDPQDSNSKSQNSPSSAAYQPVTWKNLPVRVLGDQKLVWLFPLHLAEGQHLLPTIGIVGVTGGLLAADSHIMVHVRNNTSSFHEYDKIFSGTNTGIFTALIPATFYLYGVIGKNSYSEQSALLMGEAYLDSAIPHVAMKLVSRRLRPDAVLSSSDFTDTFFKSHVSVLGKGSSFPSGHATGIFSIATVVAARYGHHRWVPWAAYGLAAAISFSRVPTFAHFPSDVFLGAALGYTITRFDVLRDRTH
ncbi:MAG TPA: phosphatase PAP2 family protein [Candidatus Acidoferrales bacterium]|nr:phosphatase PAP2 family protein [Candidatus Acidoferrales bacterium]